MKKLFTQNLGYRLGALVLAILLFAFVKTDHLTSTRISGTDSSQNNSVLMATKTTTISMPVDLDVDSKYVVKGYRENVKVTLSGSSAMITTLKNTRNFKVYLDLKDYTAGKYTVKYKVSGLGKDIKYKIAPAQAKIQISKFKKKSFDINYRYDTNMVKEGYTMGKVKASKTSVEASGSAADIDRISQVVANIYVPSNTSKDVNTQTVLQALDANGNILNVVLYPEAIDVTIPVSKSDSSDSESDEKTTSSSGDETNDGNATNDSSSSDEAVNENSSIDASSDTQVN